MKRKTFANGSWQKVWHQLLANNLEFLDLSSAALDGSSQVASKRRIL